MSEVNPSFSHPGSGSKPSGMWQPPTLEEMRAMLPQYQFVALLGRGGMGAVYKAVQVSLDRPVAIKVLPGDLIDDVDAQFAERFKNEARTMAKMNHPAIVNVFDFGETNTGLLFIVMEFIDGTDVARMILSQGRLPVDYALAITAHVCDALVYAHKNGIIHRDIKPANILINMDGAVKVADFGLAKSNDATQNGLTKTNMAMGTPDFVAPEALIPGIPLDGRADLYAVGVMLYQMLTGEIPRGMWMMPGAKLGTDPRFDAIIGKAMQTDREARYQSAAEIRRDLDVILTVPLVKAGDTHSSAAIPKQSLPPKRSADAHIRKEVATKPADRPLASVATKKSSTGFYLGMAATAVVLIAVAFLLSGGDEAESRAKTADKPTVAKPPPAPKPPKPQPAASAKPAIASSPTPKTATPSVQMAPAPPAAPDTVDTAPWAGAISLLPLVDVEKDTVKKGWKRKGSDLESGQELPALLELPVIPSEEYDLRVRFTKTQRRDNISLVLARGDHSFVWHGGIYGNSVFGFGNHQGVVGMRTSNPTVKTVAACFETGRAYTVQIAVRKTGVVAYLDGVKISELAADLAEMQPPENLKLRTPGALGLATFNTHYAVHSAELREVTGKAKLLREPVIATLTPMATSLPATAPPSADPVSQRLAQIEQQFLAAFEKQAGAAHKAAVADLNAKFAAALDRSTATVSQAGKLEEALALRNEKTLIQNAGAVPETDDDDTPDSLKALRKTWRTSMAALVVNRDKLAAPLHAAYDRALAAFQDELTKSQQLDAATRVKAVRDHIAAQRESGAPATTSLKGTTVTTAPLGRSDKSPVPVAPIAPPLPADKVLPPPVPAPQEEIRKLCEWVHQKGGSVRLRIDGRDVTFEKSQALPKGRLTLVHVGVYELSFEEKDNERQWFTLMGRVADLESMSYSKNPGMMPMEDLRGLTKAKSLNLTPAAVDDAAFAHLSGLKNLESLDVGGYGMKQFTGEGLGYITENLQELATNSPTLTAKGLAYLPRFKKLKRLNLSGTGSLTDAMLNGLAALTELEELSLSERNGLDGSFLAHLPANSKLKRLVLEDIKTFKPEHLKHLAKLKNLTFLSLPPVDPGPEGLAVIAGLDQLSELALILNPAFTGEGFKGLKGFRNLKRLNLHTCPVTDAAMDAVSTTLPELKSLEMTNAADYKVTLTPDGFSRALSRWKSMTQLNFHGERTTDAWMPAIAQLKALDYLMLTGAQITDQGLAPLMKLPLGYLRLDGTPVTDAVIPILKSCPTLNNVPVGSTNMTDAGKAELQRVLDAHRGK